MTSLIDQLRELDKMSKGRLVDFDSPQKAQEYFDHIPDVIRLVEAAEALTEEAAFTHWIQDNDVGRDLLVALAPFLEETE